MNKEFDIVKCRDLVSFMEGTSHITCAVWLRSACDEVEKLRSTAALADIPLAGLQQMAVNTQLDYELDCRKLRPEKKWRVPTDEDARHRPPCRVRDYRTESWVDDVVVAVIGMNRLFITREGQNWNFCEIEDKT